MSAPERLYRYTINKGGTGEMDVCVETRPPLVESVEYALVKPLPTTPEIREAIARVKEPGMFGWIDFKDSDDDSCQMRIGIEDLNAAELIATALESALHALEELKAGQSLAVEVLNHREAAIIEFVHAHKESIGCDWIIGYDKMQRCNNAFNKLKAITKEMDDQADPQPPINGTAEVKAEKQDGADSNSITNYKPMFCGLCGAGIDLLSKT